MRNRAPSAQSRAILKVMLCQPMEWRHGYDLAKLVGLSSGTLYPILIRLHDKGLLEATNPTRKYVTLFVSCSIPYFGRLEEGSHLGWLTL